MPRHKYLGRIIGDSRSGENYVETRLSFADYVNSQKTNEIKKPPMQGSLEDERVKSMVKEYIDKPRLFRCKDKIMIADLNSNWFVIDGQHRLNMIEELYKEHNKYEETHKFTLCWFKVKTHDELEDLFTSLNMDSMKNKYYITLEQTEKIRISNFMELFSHHFKVHFCKKKSNAPTSRIYAVEEIRDKLITMGFFSKYSGYSHDDLLKTIKDKNDEFYTLNRYEVEMETNPDSFYKDELSKIQSKFVISLKKNNFLEWLNDPDNNTPIHRRKTKKKTIPQKLRNAVWFNEYGKGTYSGVCPIPCCDNVLKNDKGCFQAGHLTSEANGGEVKLTNLRPICSSCNIQMGTTNWDDYVLQFS